MDPGGLVEEEEEAEAEEKGDAAVKPAEEEVEEEWTSVLMGEKTAGPPGTAGEMSFRPKFSRLLDTLLMLRGGALAPPGGLERGAGFSP